MARVKATITIDRAKVEKAKTLIDARTMSEAIDVALDRLIHAAQLRNDVAAYRRQPPTSDELALADVPVELDLEDDDVDYDTLYAES
jgi:hypothetical protein